MRGLESGEPIGRCDEFRIERHVRIARELNRDTHTHHFYFFTRKREKIRENRFSPDHYLTDTLLYKISIFSSLDFLNFFAFQNFYEIFLENSDKK